MYIYIYNKVDDEKPSSTLLYVNPLVWSGH